MSVTVRCGRCGKVYAAPDSLAGKKVRCRQCGKAVPVPTAGLLQLQAPPPGSSVIDPSPPPRLRPTADDAPQAPSPPTTEPPAAPVAPAPPIAPAPPAATPRWRQLADAPAPPQSEEEETELGEDDLHDDDETPDTGPASSLERTLNYSVQLPANGLFDFPGSSAVDQFMPWFILVGGTAWVLHDSVRSSPADHPGLGYLRAFIYLLTYSAVVFPIIYIATRSAVRAGRFALPPAGAARVFAAYFPPVVFGTVLWLVAGSTAALIAGMFVGLIPGIGAAWLLMRLQPYQAPRMLISATTGFLLGTVLAVALLLGVNYGLVSGYRGSDHTYQESPLGPGFGWEKPPERPKPIRAEVVAPASQPSTAASTTEPTTDP